MQARFNPHQSLWLLDACYVIDVSLFLVKVLTGSATAYSADPSKSIGKFPENAGRDTLLVSAVQVSLGFFWTLVLM